MNKKPLQYWPLGLKISSGVLLVLMSGLVFRLYTLQIKFQAQEVLAFEQGRERLIQSGRTAISLNQALIREDATKALEEEKTGDILLGWVHLGTRELFVKGKPDSFPFPQTPLAQTDADAAQRARRWRVLLSSQARFPSGLPKGLVATLELARSGTKLDADEMKIWQKNLTDLWHNKQRLELWDLNLLLEDLPDNLQPLFSIQTQLIRKALALEIDEDLFVQTNRKIGLVHFSEQYWANVRNDLSKLGLTLKDTRDTIDPEPVATRSSDDLKAKHRREQFLFLVVLFLLILVLAIVFMASRTLILIHQHRQTLLHAVSHELRTPLTNVLQLSEMLLDKRYASQEQADKYQRHIHNEGLRLQGLLENILTVAQIEKLLFEVHLQPVDVTAFLQETQDLISPVGSFFAENLKLTIDHGPAQVLMDREAFVKVVRNLLENARKYGEPPIEMRSTLQQNEWVLHVMDQGPGLPAEIQKNLFRPYVRKRLAHRDGIGLGLHLIKSITDAHRGSIRFENQNPQGLCVTLSLSLFSEAQHES